MRTYIELRHGSQVLDWRVIINPDDATTDLISERVRELTWNGMQSGDKIVVYESKMEASELKLPRDYPRRKEDGNAKV
jgi:hypothetical protein